MGVEEGQEEEEAEAARPMATLAAHGCLRGASSRGHLAPARAGALRRRDAAGARTAARAAHSYS